MSGRINPDRLNTRKIHHEASMYLLRLCANLRILMDENQPLRADPATLLEWSMHRADFEQCDEPIIRYSQHGHHHEGDISKHARLLIAANALIIELKLRNSGNGQSEITRNQVEDIERQVMQLDCRERVVFY